MDGKTMTEALEAKALEKEKTIKCPKEGCGFENPKNCLICQKCGTRLFGDHKSSEEKAMTKKAKKVLAKRVSGKTKEKKGGKEAKEGKEKQTKVKGKPKAETSAEYPMKGSVRDKLLHVIGKHPDGVSMPEIQKEMKITYRLDSYTQEFEERKLIKSKKDGMERVYIPVAA